MGRRLQLPLLTMRACLARPIDTLRGVTLTALLAIVAPSAAAANIDQERAAGVMAGYLRHIVGLTTWPAESRAAGPGAINICVLGDDPNGILTLIRARLESGGKVEAQERLVALVPLPDSTEDSPPLPQALDDCGSLYVSGDAAPQWAEIQPLIADRPVVTVSEMDEFVHRGGIVQFVIDPDAGKVLLIVNRYAMNRAGVRLSSELLRLGSVTVIDEQEVAR